ncbi:hypothetical protein GMRT_jh025 [Giardia muris]|nr:hypothetical protein GMRT_jh025 [Giardia muris]|eukprot:TNJ28718.1 hypothetical protein GMRT_jh025 [Giardia muris]
MVLPRRGPGPGARVSRDKAIVLSTGRSLERSAPGGDTLSEDTIPPSSQLASERRESASLMEQPRSMADDSTDTFDFGNLGVPQAVDDPDCEERPFEPEVILSTGGASPPPLPAKGLTKMQGKRQGASPDRSAPMTDIDLNYYSDIPSEQDYRVDGTGGGTPADDKRYEDDAFDDLDDFYNESPSEARGIASAADDFDFDL